MEIKLGARKKDTQRVTWSDQAGKPSEVRDGFYADLAQSRDE